MINCIAWSLLLLIIGLPVSLNAQDTSDWKDPSPHSVQFITVDEGVQLEVLDWGGSGSPIVLLAGLGNTAHVYDDFAQKLARDYHVYGITRRGFGASGWPESGYDVDRLGDDVLAVLDSLNLEQPVLVGHSIGGQELSSVATRFPNRLSALIYLDAAYQYAFDSDGTHGRMVAFRKMQKETPELLEVIMLRQLIPLSPPRPPPPVPQAPLPGWTDRESVSAYISATKRIHGFAMPEAETRRSMRISQDGRMNGFIQSTASWAREAIMDGGKSFRQIPVRSLAICAYPSSQDPWVKDAGPEVQQQMARLGLTKTIQNGRLIAEFAKSVPNAQVVSLSGAHHYLFITNEAEVLREMYDFLESLP